jgi:sensor histidine kinase YesM
MQLRFGGKLAVSIDIASDSLDALVPNMFLQPLVENAVLHGIAQYHRGGHVEVRAERVDGSLVITVLDDGPGLPEGWEETAHTGVGLRNTRSRLYRLYGSRQRIDIANRAEGGLRLTLTIPFHTTSVLALPAA